MKTKYVIFDLDDTLMFEIEYLKSAYREIAKTIDTHNCDELFDEMFLLYKKKEDVFDFLVCKYSNCNKTDLLAMYRNHSPVLSLSREAEDVLNYCIAKKYKLGLITDGRSITQRSKLKALGIEELFDKVVISEEFGSMKPDEKNFKYFEEEGIEEYFYIGDNTKKDFITPNKLDWISICLLDTGYNIHKQDFSLAQDFLPKKRIKELIELISIL